MEHWKLKLSSCSIFTTSGNWTKKKPIACEVCRFYYYDDDDSCCVWVLFSNFIDFSVLNFCDAFLPGQVNEVTYWNPIFETISVFFLHTSIIGARFRPCEISYIRKNVGKILIKLATYCLKNAATVNTLTRFLRNRMSVIYVVIYLEWNTIYSHLSSTKILSNSKLSKNQNEINRVNFFLLFSFIIFTEALCVGFVTICCHKRVLHATEAYLF